RSTSLVCMRLTPTARFRPSATTSTGKRSTRNWPERTRGNDAPDLPIGSMVSAQAGDRVRDGQYDDHDADEHQDCEVPPGRPPTDRWHPNVRAHRLDAFVVHLGVDPLRLAGEVARHR